MTAPPYGLLLIAGGQTHQENYARAFAADERCRLIGLTDESDISSRREKLNRQLAEELEIPVFEDLQAALQRDDVHLVSICAEPERRGRLAAQAARAGKHIYVDKPLAASVSDAKDIVQAVAETGVKSQMFSLVRSPVAQRAKAVVASGRLGELTGLHCELYFAKGMAGTADLSRPRRENPVAERFTFLDSKRELYCVGLYPLVLFVWLTGRRFTGVRGITANYFFAEHQKNNVEDFAALLLEMEGNLHATLTVGRTGWMSHPGFGIHQIHLVGTAESVVLDAWSPRLEISSDAPPWRLPEVPHPEDPMGFWSSTQQAGGVQPKSDWFPISSPAQSDASFFLDCLERNCESDVPATVGAHVVETILTAYVAAAERRRIVVPDDLPA